MRSLGTFIVIVLILFFAYILVIHPTAKSNTNTGFNNYVGSIPIRGKGEGFMEGIDTPDMSEEEAKRIDSFDGEWSFSPMKTEIHNLQIKGPFGKFYDFYYFEPRISIGYIKFTPFKMMTHGHAEVVEIKDLDFNAKLTYSTLRSMLDKEHENFKPKHMFMLENGLVQVDGHLKEVNSTVYLKGHLKVNLDGALELEVEDIIDFTNKEVRAQASRKKVLDHLDLRWEFRIIGIELELDRAAISPDGVYIEGGCHRWVNPMLGLKLPTDEIDSDSKSNS